MAGRPWSLPPVHDSADLASFTRRAHEQWFLDLSRLPGRSIPDMLAPTMLTERLLQQAPSGTSPPITAQSAQ